MSDSPRSDTPRLGAAKTAALALAVLVVVVGAALVGYQRTMASAGDSTLSTAVVTRGDVQSSVPADGRVVAEEWELSFGATGRVVSVDVSEGETVTSGQLLGSLDDTKAEAQVSQARSGLASAKAKLADLRDQPIAEDVAAKQAVVDAAESALDNAEEAYALLRAESAETTVSAAELQAKSAAVNAAKSQLHIAEANLDAVKVPSTISEIDAAEAAVADASAGLHAAESELEDYVLRAPSDGVAVSVALTEGQTLSAGTGQAPAIVIADLSSQHIEGQLDEADAIAVRAGMPVNIIVDALGGLIVTGRVERVSEVAQVDANELATFDIEVEIDAQVDGLAPGMAVRMQVITDQAADVLTIPTATVKRSDGKSVVVVVDESGAVSSVTVELGKTDGKIVEVVSGLSEGQKVALGTVKETEK
jgi:multidrug efflux pump subunit AcrA (membrane-fusion protein)